MYKNLVLVDGEIMPAEEAAVSVHDRGHQFGDGVFEIVPVYKICGRCNGNRFSRLPTTLARCHVQKASQNKNRYHVRPSNRSR